MTIQRPMPMDKAAFLAWTERQEENYEFVRGRVVMMTGGLRGHWQIAANLFRALDSRVDHDRWAVLPEFGVDVGPSTVRFPDIVVDPADGPTTDRTATAPVFLAEVMSPSSERVDLGDKAAEYLRLPSLHTYLVVAHDEPKAWVWTRAAGGFPAGPVVIDDPAAVIDVPSLGLALPLADIYRRVRFD
ncbi:Uma2 family endonuclease [Rhodoplanes sp. TEM]|uniref:Uma2 family endonuclease n=1 Tax=Rhodoplanes tepidamans TaxID=200616 RepID=A0ABT5JCE3_RHOTP|nr:MULTISPECIES: Uma2 family endonuclease [Rhodoplanes]MDC7787277.1 Uma2 family endonuclease [Rhodoplanes tepidamans]MDC7985305.1 Uma2 family endonuclease [Rhodoplanes sp. TEM]MDQ0357812.1 Uma2 family endonuclease [Rhodoplanes tepidamans]